MIQKNPIPQAIMILYLSLLAACQETNTSTSTEESTPQAKHPSKETLKSTPPQKEGCKVRAFVIDKDPQGLNVRDKPTAKGSTVLGQLPTQKPVDVTITQSENSWFYINSASDIDGNNKMPQTGWVSGSLLGIGIRNYGPTSKYYLHKEASSKSLILSDPGQGDAKLIDCKGRWLKVEREGKIGWLSPEGQCPSAVTNCS